MCRESPASQDYWSAEVVAPGLSLVVMRAWEVTAVVMETLAPDWDEELEDYSW